jgi:ComF family protein
MSNTASARHFIKALGTAALGLVLPPRCIGSGDIVGAQGTLSPDFFQKLTFISDPFCAVCGLPFSVAVEGSSLCGACLEEPPNFSRARAALAYNDASKDIILALKYGDKTHAVETFAPMMLQAGRDVVAASDIIIPVPLHFTRLWQRRFNQAALLAQALGRRAGLRVENDALIRAENTIPQRGLSRRERNDNVKNAFAVRPGKQSLIAQKNILLIDDVFTSGATLNACARMLLKSGAAAVNVLTIARVTREEF